MTTESDTEKVKRFEEALSQFIDRLQDDRYVLGVVRVGQLSEETIWRREAISIWIIESDGVSRRLRSDGNDERIFRCLVEDGINIHAEVIPRTRFKLMVEGSSRTAFSCNFFASRELIFCKDSSIEKWFAEANSIAQKDQQRELLTFTTWTTYASRIAHKRLKIKKDLDLAKQEIIGAAHSIAYTEIIRHGQVWESDVIYRAIDLAPELFQKIYLDVLSKRKSAKTLEDALRAIDEYLTDHYQEHLRPLLHFLKKQNRTVPLSEISDHFAFSQVYPWHLESACEWMEQNGILEKLSAPFKLTKRSQEQVEEPAYYFDPAAP